MADGRNDDPGRASQEGRQHTRPTVDSRLQPGIKNSKHKEERLTTKEACRVEGEKELVSK